MHNLNHTVILEAPLLLNLDQRADHEAAQSTVLNFRYFFA